MNRPLKLLWCSLALTLLASLSHVAVTFGTLEPGGPPAWLASVGPYAGIVAAVAIDAGLAALAWAVGERARHDEKSGDLWAGVVVFALLSALANFDHALGVVGAGQPASEAWTALGTYERVKVGALSATLPLLVAYLARVIETAAHGSAAPTTAAQVGTDKRQVRAPRPAQNGRTRERSNGRAPTDTERQALTDAAGRSPNATIADLARSIGAPRQTVSRWVGGMVKAGELARTPNGWRVPGGEA